MSFHYTWKQRRQLVWPGLKYWFLGVSLRRSILYIRLVLILAGVVCLSLSDFAVPRGSWLQSTLGVFGVGFVIGGVVVGRSGRT